jgi:tetraacyldisaccharide 4'-kinase
VLPAGPLREPVAAGAARCQAAVVIGNDSAGAAAMLPADLPVLRARLVPGTEAEELAGRKLFAFAGIASPEKFFATLRQAGVVLAATAPFPDHHRYSDRELRHLLDEATRLGAAPATTRKDAVRLPADIRRQVHIVGVTLAWDDPASLEALLLRTLGDQPRKGDRHA